MAIESLTRIKIELHMYLLDTDALSNLLDQNRSSAALRRRYDQEKAKGLSISTVTVAELLKPVLAAVNNERFSKVKSYSTLMRAIKALTSFRILGYTDREESIFMEIPSSIRQRCPNDCRIAATARVNDLIVVTQNTKDYSRIGIVEFEDWSV
ncbi:type II toxin-antitoxin system VapC family toxin [Gloeobacter morelensis]|uniref:Type II toxin-antitoxin system VapC family toxin n=1 Tax=Gloeobacter morelensis MG652769 TaxID=2781736 RepID=A0ABY3PIL5_9CYAN|nr:type II toxin-antitoxin system VapC family toxin [Gloeobacter morelensis]UFP93471.1 type II toxin-antitoxin system VapC family toxin [Gloeobacter morelensis MG652769]